MFLNKKRLLLTLYRLEEGQQTILERLERMTSHQKCDTSSATASPQGEGGGEADKWIMDGIQAILSYRRDKEKNT